MRIRLTVDEIELQLLVHALEEKHQNILEEMMAPHGEQDDYVEAVEALRQTDAAVKRFTKLLWGAENRKVASESRTATSKNS